MWNKYHISLVVQTAILVFIQIILLNNIRLFGYFLPILYIYPFLKMPINLPQWSLTLIAFISGLIMDMIMNTPGINCAAITAAVYFRENTLRFLVDEDELEENESSFIPSFRSMKAIPFISYLLIITTIHIGLIMLLEAFSTHLYSRVVPYILGSIAISLLFFIIFESFQKRRKNAN